MTWRRAATIVELRTKPQKLRAEQADQLRQALLPFAETLPEEPLRALRHHIDRLTVAYHKWTFVMLSPDQNAAVVGYLRKHSSRPAAAMELWACCFRHLDIETGEILQTRAGLAKEADIDADSVSRVMTELVGVGAIIRHRERGRVRYFMNPRVATHLENAARAIAQDAAPPLLTLLHGRDE